MPTRTDSHMLVLPNGDHGLIMLVTDYTDFIHAALPGHMGTGILTYVIYWAPSRSFGPRIRPVPLPVVPSFLWTRICS